MVWLFTGSEGDARSTLPLFRERLLASFAASSVPQEDLDGFCEAVAEALSEDPADRVSAQAICSHLERLAQAWLDEDQVPTQFQVTSDALEQTGDFDFTPQSAIDSRPGSGSGDETPRPAPLGKGGNIGRFRIRRKLGEGGMGAVYEAVDPSDDRIVAIKVLSRRVLHKRDALKRFRKEARILGEIKSPFVTNLLEVNEDRGLHYIVMEFVDGVDLKHLIRKGQQFEERVALALIADTARGLVSAHEQEIIHRDIKPANILLSCTPSEASRELDASSLSFDQLKGYQVKLSDFGLARQMEQSESMDVTRAGGVVGTPTYMSPEQFSGSGQISPATDVYAMGVTLFEMLAGQPPFQSSDLTKLISLHCRENPTPLQKLSPDVSDATCEIIHRAMAKDPQQRYADAAQFLTAVEALLRGESTNISVHPEMPPHEKGEIFEEVFQWHLKSSAEQLWPYVSNTERINCAVGVPSVKYETRRDDQGRLRKYGLFKMAGMQIGWEEHPFEWVEGQRLGILREFNRGPFVWFLSIVELIPHAGGGTLLRHTVRIRPRGIVGRLVAKMEVSIKGKRNLDRVYHRIDEAVSGALGSDPTLDPFCEPDGVSTARERRLEQRLGQLAARGVDPEVAQCLEHFLHDAPSQELARIRPLALARTYGIESGRLISGCLAAAKEGLLDLHWDILCPTCRISSQVANTLQDIENHVQCEVCDIDFVVDLANCVELIFRANPEIRDADLGTYCIGGPEHSPHVVLQIRLAAGKRVELTPVLAEGEYVLRSAQLTSSHRIRALPGKGTTHTEIVLTPELEPTVTSRVRAGRNVLTVTNDYDHEVVIRLERTTPQQDVLTAAQASAIAEFRELFPDETPMVGRLINVATITLLSVDIADTEHLYFDLGDGTTFALVNRFHGLLERIAKQHNGVLIRTQGTEALFAFETPQEVIHAMADFANDLSEDDQLDLQFCAAVHRGTALATSSDGHLDYFGGTVHLVQRIVRQAGAGELLLTEQVAADPLVAQAIATHRLPREVGDLPRLGKHGQRCQRLRFQTG